jgi:hypothetical protein
MYQTGPYRPFPSEMRADDSAAFCEIPLSDGSGSTYVIMRARRYLEESDVSMMERGIFSFEEMYPELKDLGYRPPDENFWIYRVESFDVAKEHHVDQEVFADYSQNYKQVVFVTFDTSLAYCQREFGISLENFKKRWETNYPDR